MSARLCAALALVAIVLAACQPSREEESRDKLKDLYMGNAQIYYESGHYRSALVQVTKVLELDPENQKARFVRAMSHLRIGGPESAQIALSELELLVKEDFDVRQFRVWLGLGMARAAVGDLYDARFRLLEQRLAAEPSAGPEIIPQREKARKERDRLWRASNEACREVLSYEDIPVARNDPIALYHIYRNHSLLGEHERALEYQKRHLAVIEGSREQWEKSIEEYPAGREIYETKLKGTRKNEIAVREAMALTLYRLGRHEEAIDHLSRSILLGPGRAEPYLNRAQVFRKLGRHAEAVLDLKKFIKHTELTPDDEDAQKAVELLRDSEQKMLRD